MCFLVQIVQDGDIILNLKNISENFLINFISVGHDYISLGVNRWLINNGVFFLLKLVVKISHVKLSKTDPIRGLPMHVMFTHNIMYLMICLNSQVLTFKRQ